MKKKKKKKVGQITIKKVGKKWAACISGTPQELFNSFNKALEEVEGLRKKYGRRHYENHDKRNKNGGKRKKSKR